MTEAQIENEIQKVVKLIDEVYKKFGFTYHVELSTRPDDSMGTEEEWEVATNALENAIKAMNIPYEAVSYTHLISMGYAEVSGLPAVFGLYGSVLPILFFALFSTSPQFIFGVDAAPAAIAGAALASLGIESGSVDALRYIPVIALFVGLWLLLFYFLKAGKLVTFISTPVMGGFILSLIHI